MEENDVKYIIVHGSYTPTSMDVSPQDIHHWHLDRGFSLIGYHYFIKRTGGIFNGRPTWMEGAHALGYNDNSIGICLEGGKCSFLDNWEFNYNHRQLTELASLLGKICREFPTPLPVIGHRDVSKKLCPGFDIRKWWNPNAPDVFIP